MSTFDNRRPLAQLLADNASYKLLTWMRKYSRRKGDFRGIAVPIDDVVGMRLIATGRFELTQLDAIRTLLTTPDGIGGRMVKAPGTFLDIGANIGVYTLALSRFFESTIALEANPVTFKVLEANVALADLRNVQCYCHGVSDQARQANLYMPNNGNLGWATLDIESHPESKSFRQISISLNTLDNLAEQLMFSESPISFIKIDVEGHETEVLRGASGILQRWKPAVVFEVLPGGAGRKCIKILREHGYVRFYRFRRSFRGAARPKTYLSGLIHGLPIAFDEINVNTLDSCPLVCAVTDVNGSAS